MITSQKLNDELQALQRNPDLPHVLAGDFLYDESMACPSLEAICSLFTFLSHPSIKIECNAVEWPFIAAHVVSENDFSWLKSSANMVMTQRKMAEVASTDVNEKLFDVVNSRLVVELLCYLNKKARGLVKSFIPIISMSSLATKDSSVQRAVSTYIETDFFDEKVVVRQFGSSRLKVSQFIANEILLWTPHLRHELGKEPSKSQIKEFLLTLEPDKLSGRDEAWSQAFKLLKFPNNRNSRMTGANRDRIIELALAERDRMKKTQKTFSIEKLSSEAC